MTNNTSLGLAVLRRIAYWLLAVPLCGAIPIALHLCAAFINNPSKMYIPILADTFLYVFILAMTAVADMLGDSSPGPQLGILTAIFFSGIAAVCYFMLSITLMAGRVAPWLHDLSMPVLGFTVSGYCAYKIPTLWFDARSEWFDRNVSKQL